MIIYALCIIFLDKQISKYFIFIFKFLFIEKNYRIHYTKIHFFFSTNKIFNKFFEKIIMLKIYLFIKYGSKNGKKIINIIEKRFSLHR